MLGTSELLLIALIALLLFGGNQLPKLARSLGEFISEFNRAKDTSSAKTKKAKAKTKTTSPK